MTANAHTPDELERHETLRTAFARYEELRFHEALAETDPPLAAAEALELLALGETIARKARHGRRLTVRTARPAGASWAQIGRALGTSRQSAWEAHMRWITDRAGRHRRGNGPPDTPAGAGPPPPPGSAPGA